MELQIRGRNVEINDQIRSHVEEKLGQLGRHNVLYQRDDGDFGLIEPSG